MSKETKIIVFSVILVFVLSGILVFLGNSMVNLRVVAEATKSKQVDLVKLDQLYRQEARRIISDYSNSEATITAEKVSQLRDQLLALTVPGKFRDLHYSLIFAMDKMASYLTSGNNQDKLASQSLISRAKTDYTWLN